MDSEKGFRSWSEYVMDAYIWHELPDPKAEPKCYSSFLIPCNIKIMQINYSFRTCAVHCKKVKHTDHFVQPEVSYLDIASTPLYLNHINYYPYGIYCGI